ncbi:MFS transporter [Symbiobacterium thermophilum]|nr:MFS transporter [Symbiobacterium thermophilum]
MEPWRRNVAVLWIAVFIAASAWTMVMPFMPVFLSEDLGVGAGVTVWAGLLGAVNSGFSALTAPIWGALGDRWGRKAMMVRAGIFLGSAYVLMAFVRNPYELLGVRVMIGALTGFIPTATALVATTTPERHMGQALSLVATGNQAGSILGPMLGGFLADLIGIRNTMALSGVAVFAATLLVVFAVREQFQRPARQPAHFLSDMRQVLQGGPLIVVLAMSLLLQMSQSAMEPVLIPHIRQLLGSGSPNWMAGVIYSVPGIAFVLAAPSWARLGERWGYTTTVTIGLAGGALFTLPQALVQSGLGMGSFRLSAGLALAAVTPGISALIAASVPREQRGKAFGLNQSAFNVGAMLGPLLGGVLGDRVGIRWVFPATALLLLFAAGWCWSLVRARVRQHRDSQLTA